jgi:succinoglycan biosynthesis transport protein ExoP
MQSPILPAITPRGTLAPTVPPTPVPFAAPPRSSQAATEDSVLLDLGRFIRRNYAIPLAAMLLGLALAIAFTESQPPVYRGTATLEIQDLNDNFLNLKEVSTVSPSAAGASPSDLQTQLRILQSGSLIGRVLDQLPRENTPPKTGLLAWQEQLRGSHPAQASREDLLENAAQKLQVREARQARIVDLLYDSGDPQYAAAFVNKLAQQYIDQSIEARLQVSQVTSDWLGGQLTQLRLQLENAEKRLQQYTRTSGLVVMAEQHSPAEDKLRQIQLDLSKAQENRITKQARLETAIKAPPESLDVPVGSALRDYQAKLTDLRRQRADLMIVFTPDFDGIKRLDAQISALESAAQAESASILQSIRNDYDDSMRRENLLESGYMKQIGQVSQQAESVVEYEILKREVDTNRRLYENMLQRTAEAKVASALRASNARLLDPARPPRRPYRPSWVLNLMWGGTAGLLLGLVIATGRERLDRRIKQPGELAACLNLPELGAVPKLRALPPGPAQTALVRGGGRSPDVSVALATWNSRWNERASLESESFRAILTSILFSNASGETPQVIAVTSALPSEGKTTLVTNLAAALAHMRRKVLLIDGDTQTGRLHEYFGQPADHGLFDLLSLDSGDLQYMVQESSLPGVCLMAIGPRNQSVLDLLPGMADLLCRAREEFDTILIDNISLRDVPDARVLARMADGVVLVVRAGVTSREAVLAAHARLTQDGSRLLGTVLNHWVQ